ncbi:ABC transporter permease [Halogeometricum borinquense]|uniref:ABC transporter permease n=1 Tax=Halogeometricum borinquense TaxID=60847 RepID=UPI00342F3B3C
MSRVRFLIRRTVFAVVAAISVLTVVFLLITVPKNPNVAAVKFNAAMSGRDPQAAAEAYRASHNLGKSLWWRYTHWMSNVLQFRWGMSQSVGAPVVAVLKRAAPYTLAYLVPGVILSIAVGVSAGVMTALRRQSITDRLGASISYLGYGIPNFFLGSLLLVLVGTQFGWDGTGFRDGLVTTKNAKRYVLPTLILASTLTASQLRYTRSLSADLLGHDFVRLVRAKGASTSRIARHILRNAAVPLLTLSFADLLGVLVLNIFVLEFVFGIPGIGTVSLRAIRDRDVPLVLGTTTLFIFVGVLGNLVQDLAYVVLDPRIEECAFDEQTTNHTTACLSRGKLSAIFPRGLLSLAEEYG